MTVSEKPLFSNRRLSKIIIPLLFEQYLAILVGMADTVMVSSVGEHAVSGVSLVNNLSAVMLNLFTALAAGGGIVTSQFIGAKRPDDDGAESAACIAGAIPRGVYASHLLRPEPRADWRAVWQA